MWWDFDFTGLVWLAAIGFVACVIGIPIGLYELFAHVSVIVH